MKRKLKILPKTLKNKIKSILIIILIVCINFPSTVIQLYIFQNNFLEFLEKIVNGLNEILKRMEKEQGRVYRILHQTL